MKATEKRLDAVLQRIVKACGRAGRDPESVRLLAVSKRHPAASVRQLALLGQKSFGENLLSEALDKQAQLEDLALEWHFIGAIQSNKTRDLAAHFDWVQSVDREKILQRLSSQRPASRPPLNICLQVNIDREPQKAGADPERIPGLAALAASLPGLRLRGLMSLPAVTDTGGAAQASLAATRELYQRLVEKGHDLDTLSMGMSADLEDAILEGSTLVRVGTDLLGPRNGLD